MTQFKRLAGERAPGLRYKAAFRGSPVTLFAVIPSVA